MKPATLILAVSIQIAAAGPAWEGESPAAPAEQRPPSGLTEILTTARRNNPGVRAARLRWEAMKLRVPQMRAWEDPKAGVDFERMGTTRLNTYTDAEWMISQEIPVSGKNRSRARSAEAEAKAAFEELRRAELDTLSKVRSAWFKRANASAQLEINQKNRELLEQLVEVSRVKYESGTQTQSDLLMAQTELVRLSETRANLERDLVAQESVLNSLMGRAARSPIGRPEPLVFKAFSPGSVEQFAAEHRPEIAMAVLRIEAAQAEHQLAKRQWIPDPELRIEARSFREDGGGSIREYDTGIFFNIPWINYRKYSAGVAEAQKRIEAAREDLKAARIETSALIRDQLQTIESASKNYLLFRDSLSPLARQSAESARAGYESNKSGFAELITAQRTLNEVESSMTEQLASYQVAVAELSAIAGSNL